MKCRYRATACLLVACVVNAHAAEYRSVSVDAKGQLHIVLRSGREILPPKIQHQVSFDRAAISPDGRTVGWLVMHQDPYTTYYKGAVLAFRLSLYRGGAFHKEGCILFI